MKHKSIDDIIWDARTGRCISTAQIENAARELTESRLSDLANVDIEDDKENLDWGFQLRDLMNLGCKFRKYTYIDMIRSVIELSDEDKGINADIFMFISFLGAMYHKIRIPWFNLSAECVMLKSGFGNAWDDYFVHDAVLWENNKKRVPTVGEILKCAFELFSDSAENIKLAPVSEKVYYFDKDTYRKPFCRDINDYPVYESGKDIKQQYREYNARLASIWAYYLMIAVPAKLTSGEQDADTDKRV